MSDRTDYIDKFIQKIEDDYFKGDWNGFVKILFDEQDQDFQIYVNENILITDNAKELGEKEFNDVVSFIELNNKIYEEYGFAIVESYKMFGKRNPWSIINDGRYNISFIEAKSALEIDRDIDISEYDRQRNSFGELIEHEIDFDELFEEFEQVFEEEDLEYTQFLQAKKTEEELKCIADELLQKAYEYTQYGNCVIDKSEVIATAKHSLGLNIDDEEIKTVYSMIDKDEFLLDGYVDPDLGEIDIMMGWNRCLNGIVFVEGEEEEKRYHKFLGGYERFEKEFPIDWDYFTKELILPIEKDGQSVVTALTADQAKKIYQDVVVGDILDDDGKIKSKYHDELIQRKQERKEWAYDVIASHNTCGNVYLLLGRMISDNDYYINRGHHEKHLWAGDVAKQTRLMKALYLSFDDERKPEWLSLRDIAEYQKNMSRVKFENDMSKTVTTLLRLYKDTFPYDWQDYTLYNDAFAENVIKDVREEIIQADEKEIDEYLYDHLLEPFEECDEETRKEALEIKKSFEDLRKAKKNYRIILDDEINIDKTEIEVEDMVEEEEELEEDYDLEL